jgi:hypothetical protein
MASMMGLASHEFEVEGEPVRGPFHGFEFVELNGRAVGFWIPFAAGRSSTRATEDQTMKKVHR